MTPEDLVRKADANHGAAKFGDWTVWRTPYVGRGGLEAVKTAWRWRDRRTKAALLPPTLDSPPLDR